MIPPKHFDISPLLTGGCSEGLDAFRFFFNEGNKFTKLDTFLYDKGAFLQNFGNESKDRTGLAFTTKIGPFHVSAWRKHQHPDIH